MSDSQSTDEQDDDDQKALAQLQIDLRHALVGGAIAAAVTGVIVILSGRLSASEAQVLLEESLPTTRFLCSGVMAASATTLALMLTLLSVSGGTDRDLKAAHYQRVRQIALIDTIAFIGATVLLLLLSMSFGEADRVTAGWYDAIYYAVMGCSALLGGTLISVMLMLYKATCDMITVFAPGMETSLVVDEDEVASS